MAERSRSPSPVFKDSDDEYDTKSMHSLPLDDSPKQRLAALSSLQDRVPVENLAPPRSPPIDTSATITASLASIKPLANEKEQEETTSSQRTPVDSTKFVSPPPSAGVPLSIPVKDSDTASISSETQRKLRPDSVLINVPKSSLILGVAVVDFNHAVSGRYMYNICMSADCKCEAGRSPNRILKRTNILR